MDKLHMELMNALEIEHERAEKADMYCTWWKQETAKSEQLQEEFDALEKENIMLRARVSELEKLNNPPYPATFSADLDMCEPVCDIPMKA